MTARDKARRAGIRDVAAAAGVSPTTVSHAFSGARSLSPETQARVLQEADRLGYSPDPRARGLRTGRTYMIGFLSDSIATSPHAGAMITGAQDVASQHHSVLAVVDSQGLAGREELQIRALLAHRVDGFVYSRMFHQPVEVPALLRDQHVVLADASTTDPAFSWVIPDEFGIGVTATRHLLEHGHTRIGMSTIDPAIAAAHGRGAGYRAALAEAGVAVDESLISRTTADQAGGRASARRLLERPDPATAVFCFNDEVAMGVYQVASSLGLSVPHDVSIVGVDDLRIISRGLQPTLTTVALPHEAMGRWAMLRMIAAIEGTHPEPQQEALPGLLVVRDSVVRPR